MSLINATLSYQWRYVAGKQFHSASLSRHHKNATNLKNKTEKTTQQFWMPRK